MVQRNRIWRDDGTGVFTSNRVSHHRAMNLENSVGLACAEARDRQLGEHGSSGRLVWSSLGPLECMIGRLLTVLTMVFLMAGCAAGPTGSVSASQGECSAGASCEVSGVLQIHIGTQVSTAVVVAEEACTKLALPKSFFYCLWLWKGKQVVVKGVGYLEPEFDQGDDVATFWYEERGRPVSLGACDGGVVVFVDAISTASGRLKMTFCDQDQRCVH